MTEEIRSAAATSPAPPADDAATEQRSPNPRQQEMASSSPSENASAEPLRLESSPAPAALETSEPAIALETAPSPSALETTPVPPALEAVANVPLIPAQTGQSQTAAMSTEQTEIIRGSTADNTAGTELTGDATTTVAPTRRSRQTGKGTTATGGRRKKAVDSPEAVESAVKSSPSVLEPAPEETPPATSGETSGKKWYVIRVTSGREESIKTAIERKIRIEGLEPYFGQIVIPYEEVVLKKTVKVKDKKTGETVPQEKKVIKKQKKFPGYLFAELEINDRILYLFRETSGVGDFVGSRSRREPTPMTEREIQQILSGVALSGERKKVGPKQIVKLDFEKGDKVRIREGAFANMEGEVKAITEAKEEGETPKVTVVVTVFGRPVDVTVDYWQVDKV